MEVTGLTSLRAAVACRTIPPQYIFIPDRMVPRRNCAGAHTPHGKAPITPVWKCIPAQVREGLQILRRLRPHFFTAKFAKCTVYA